MKELTFSRVTPQSKAIAINDKFGNKGIKKQQGTTRIIYDSLPLDGTTNFEFFKNSQNRPFPLSNTGSDGNKLGVGSTLIIERAYLSVVEIKTGLIASITPLTDPNLQISEMSIEIANSRVVQTIPILSFDPRFNKNACHTNYNNFEFDTQLAIPPLLEFLFRLRSNTYTAAEGFYLRLTVEGTGAIIAPRATF